MPNALRPSPDAELLDLQRSDPSARFNNALRSLLAHRLNREGWLPEDLQSEPITVGDTVAGMVPGYGLAHGYDTGNAVEMGLGAVPLAAVARGPLTNALRETVVPRLNEAGVNVTRRFNAPTIGVEATSPDMLQQTLRRYDGTPANDPAGLALGDERYRMAREAAGGPYSEGPVTNGQGAWLDEKLGRFENNRLYVQELPARNNALANDRELGGYLGRIAHNTGQEVVGAVRFNPFPAGRNPRAANALSIGGGKERLSDETITRLGQAVKGDGFVAHQPDGRAVIVPFDAGKVQEIAERARNAAPGAPVRYGVSNDLEDRIAYPYSFEEDDLGLMASRRDKPPALLGLEAKIRAHDRR